MITDYHNHVIKQQKTPTNKFLYTQVYFKQVSAPPKPEEDPALRLGIGMDASVSFFFRTHLFILIYNYKSFQVTPIPGKADTLLAQTTDFFYPLVDDPYMQVLPIKHCQRHNAPRLLSLKLELSHRRRSVHGDNLIFYWKNLHLNKLAKL